MIDYIEKAKAFAMMAHKGQTDKAGEDYFTAHVAVVADGVEPDPLVKAAAYLHDTVEDTRTRRRPRFPRRCWLLRININHKLIDQNHKSGIM